MRVRGLVIAVVVLVAAAALPLSARADGGDGATARGRAAWSQSPVDFVARGGIGQLFVTDAEPGQTVDVWHWRGLNGKLTVERVNSAVADDFGSAMFRQLRGGMYSVRVGNQIEWRVPVERTRNVRPPDQAFYDDQALVEGFQYIETRDGTTLSAYVVLPGPIEDGPYPTVVEYSGYDPSNPLDGVANLGDIDPTPLCPSLPILCKAPAQPASLLAGLLGYAVVGVNIRGTGCSGGAYDFFEQMQVLDGYDVIETVAAQEWVLDHGVGMVGLSYPGIAQLFVAQSQPPSLAAISPLSVYGDTATGVLAPGGLLNTGFATQWADNVLDDAAPYGTRWVRALVDAGDTECDRNQKLRLQNVDATEKARANRFYTTEIAGPLDIREFVGDINVPVFLASAFQDEQTGPSFGDLLGEFESSPSVRETVYNGLHADGFAPQILREWGAFLDLYVGKRVPSVDPLIELLTPVFTGGIYGGPVAMPADRWTDVTTHSEALARWESEPEIKVLFESGNGGGSGLPIAAWETQVDEWPPAGTHAARWWLHSDGALAGAATDPEGEGVAFHPDPAVSQTSFHAGGNIWDRTPNFNWVPQAVGDNARFQTEPLDEDLVMVGTASVDLWLRSDATDAEVEAVLSEVRPDGQEMRVQAGQLQASYRALDGSSTELQPVQYGFEDDWAPLVPGEWTFVRIPIPAFAHAFRAGSSVRLTINTPGGDTARWEFELDGPGAEATHVIGTGVDHPSSIAVPVVAGLTPPTQLAPCGSLRGQPCRTAPPIDNAAVGDR